MTAVTMRQRQVPDNLLGRITSLYHTALRGSEAPGALGGGPFAAVAGIRVTILLGAIPIAATIILLTWHHRAPPAREQQDSPAPLTGQNGQGRGVGVQTGHRWLTCAFACGVDGAAGSIAGL